MGERVQLNLTPQEAAEVVAELEEQVGRSKGGGMQKNGQGKGL